MNRRDTSKYICDKSDKITGNRNYFLKKSYPLEKNLCRILSFHNKFMQLNRYL